jgi:hypothetical protein
MICVKGYLKGNAGCPYIVIMCAKRGFPEILHEKAMAGMRLAMAFLF